MRSRRTLNVKIPAGVDNGTRVQLAGQGEIGPGGGPAGDLYVEIHVAPHETFTRQGTDLQCTVSVPMTAAALGTTLTLPTLEADLAAADDGRRRRPSSSRSARAPSPAPEQALRGRGVPGLRGGRGDLVVTVLVDTPTRLDARQEELLRELAAIRGEETPDRRGARRRTSRSSAGSATRSTSDVAPPSTWPRTLAGARPGHVVVVEGDEAHHAVAVRRLREGEPVVLTDGAGRGGRGDGVGDRAAAGSR